MGGCYLGVCHCEGGRKLEFMWMGGRLAALSTAAYLVEGPKDCAGDHLEGRKCVISG